MYQQLADAVHKIFPFNMYMHTNYIPFQPIINPNLSHKIDAVKYPELP
jgi:hypothetical protein